MNKPGCYNIISGRNFPLHQVPAAAKRHRGKGMRILGGVKHTVKIIIISSSARLSVLALLLISITSENKFGKLNKPIYFLKISSVVETFLYVQYRLLLRGITARVVWRILDAAKHITNISSIFLTFSSLKHLSVLVSWLFLLLPRSLENWTNLYFFHPW